MTIARLTRSIALAACAFLHAPVYAQDLSVLKFDPPASSGARTMPNPARTPEGALDFSFAISEICYPFILDGASPNELKQRPGVSSMPQQSGTYRGHWIRDTVSLGHNSPMIVKMDEDEVGRACTLQVNIRNLPRGKELMDRIHEWPLPLKVVRPPVHDLASKASSTVLCAVNAKGGEDVILIQFTQRDLVDGLVDFEVVFRRNTDPIISACNPAHFGTSG